MKDIKSYVIGFLTCVCLFLIMGQTKETQSKYQFAVQRGIDTVVNGFSVPCSYFLIHSFAIHILLIIISFFILILD